MAARDSSTRVFKTSMFVEPRKNVTFELTYQQLLPRVSLFLLHFHMLLLNLDMIYRVDQYAKSPLSIVSTLISSALTLKQPLILQCLS